MRALNYYTVGEDALPIPGLDIGYFEKHTSFGMFESLDACSGTVEIWGGEEFPEEEINIDSEGFDEYGEAIAKVMYVGADEFPLLRGVVWCYVHDYYAAIDPDMFPFQCDEQLAIAIKHGIVKKVNEVITERTGKNVDVEMKFKTKIITVEYLGRLIDLKFFNYKNDADGYYFHAYKDHNADWGM